MMTLSKEINDLIQSHTEEVQTAIKRLSRNKAPGIDGIDAILLRNLPKFIKATTEEFYKEVSRASGEVLLENRQNGTFIIRPSKNSNLGTMSVIQDGKIFHLGIRMRDDGCVSLGNEKQNEKCFKDLDCLINYYISNYLVLYSEGETTLTLLIPYRENKIP